MTLKRIVVLGGSSQVGQALVEHLARKGHNICVPSRHPERLKALKQYSNVQMVKADIRSPAELSKLLKHSPIVVNLINKIGLGHERSNYHQAYGSFIQLLAQTCTQQAPDQLISLSSASAYGKAFNNEYVQNLQMGEKRLMGLTRSPVLVIQASWILGRASNEVERYDVVGHIAKRLKRWPWVSVEGSELSIAPIHIDDFVVYVESQIVTRQPKKRKVVMVGPHRMSIMELVQKIKQQYQLRGKAVSAQSILGRFLSVLGLNVCGLLPRNLKQANVDCDAANSVKAEVITSSLTVEDLLGQRRAHDLNCSYSDFRKKHRHL